MDASKCEDPTAVALIELCNRTATNKFDLRAAWTVDILLWFADH